MRFKSADQDRLSGGVHLLNLVDHGAELALLGEEHAVLVVHTTVGTVGGNLHDVQIVNGGKLVLLRFGSTRHARQLLEHTEVVLEGDGGERLVLAFDLDAFLRFQCLVQPFAVTAADHQTARKFVHNEDLSVLHDVVLVTLKQRVRTQRLLDEVVQLGVVHVGKAVHLEELLCLGNALGGQQHGALLDVAHVVAAFGLADALHLVGLADFFDVLAAGEPHHKAIGFLVHKGGFFAVSADDQRGTRLVDEDGVHLVHDGVVQCALHHALLIDAHVVAQVVEPKFVVGAIGDVAAIGFGAFVVGQIVDDAAHRQAQKAVDFAHPLGVTIGKIVVDGDDVHALTA